jgi:hypothetical protein
LHNGRRTAGQAADLPLLLFWIKQHNAAGESVQEVTRSDGTNLPRAEEARGRDPAQITLNNLYVVILFFK